MRLLFITQALDLDDPVLSVYHTWVAEIAKHYEHVEAICLKEGRHNLPQNVSVHSLGKEGLPTWMRRFSIFSRLAYTYRFYQYLWKLRHSYDAVFVHMNQEYVLLGGPFWKMFRKPIYMWRNHYAGSFLTDAAAFFCTNVFCTSTHSYTAKYKKTVFMPVGVDTKRFSPNSGVERTPNSILFFARMSPSKNPLLLLEALRELKEKGTPFTASFVGSPAPEHEAFYRSLVGRAEHYGLSEQITFHPGVPNDEAPNLFRAHEIFVNCSPPGMYDKMLFEAAGCGTIVLALSTDYRALAGKEYAYANTADLAAHLETQLGLSQEEKASARAHMESLVAAQALPLLAEKLAILMTCPTSSSA